MMNRVTVVSLILLLVAFVAATFVPSHTIAQPALAKMKWEYNVVVANKLEDLGGGKGTPSMAAGLNKLGEDGWELVAIEPGHVPPPVRLPIYVFKRPK